MFYFVTGCYGCDGKLLSAPWDCGGYISIYMAIKYVYIVYKYMYKYMRGYM